MQPILGPGDYFGHKRRSYEIPGARFTEMAYSPSFNIPRHAHECAFFGLVLEGAYTETYERRTRECGPSTLLFHPEAEAHSEVHQDVVVRIFSVEPAVHWFEQARDRTSRLNQPFASQGGPLVQIANRLYREFRQPDPLTPIALEGLLLELLATAGRLPANENAPRWLQQVRDILHDRFDELLSLQEISQLAGVHPAHLARSFRLHYHCTVGDYLRALRLDRACHDLVESDTPPGEIAVRIGYSDQSHFATAFKRRTGMTPGQYRKLFRNR